MSTAFPNYLEIPQRVPHAVWRAARVASVAAAIGLIVLLVTDPDTGLDVLYGAAIPLLPLVWLVAPGVWRNVCPFAAVNQGPRTLGFSRQRTLPAAVRTHAPLVAAAVFLVIVALRRPFLDDSGIASAAVVAGMLTLAFAGGLVFKGKSGWCSTFCPLLSVQRVYGQTPFVTVPNDHCRPCVGCTRNCYDFNPRAAWQADLADPDERLGAYRRLFAGALPGVVLAHFTLGSPDEIGTVEYVARFALAVAGSAGTFFLLEAVLPLSSARLTACFGAAAIVLFYWHAGPLLSRTVLGEEEAALVWPVRVGVAALAVTWLARSFARERAFVRESAAPPDSAVGGTGLDEALAARSGDPEVTFAPSGARVVAKAGVTLLEVAERSRQPIESGCRMGVCGADPVCVVEGMENLSPAGGDERATIERLGLAPSTRMACCARVQGPVTLSLSPEPAGEGDRGGADGFEHDPAVKRVVVLGNGIAGVTAADHVRRHHPDCTIDLVADEAHQFYNRMGISRLIYGRSAMIGLQLLPDAWYDDHRVTTWLNTLAVEIAREAREVVLGTGARLPYDRLILASGSEPQVPPIPGFDTTGAFTLRHASDAMAIRDYAQRHRAQTAVVAGGGLLGLEAAYALKQLHLGVTVLERSDWLLRRQLDRRSSELLRTYLAGLGLEVMTATTVGRLESGDDGVESVVLGDGRRIPADVFLVAAGIVPNVGLAREAGLDVARGVVVDDAMRTSDPSIFAVGDVAEHGGRIYGLWTAAVEQAEAAASNAVAAPDAPPRTYAGTTPVTMLKVVGVDLMSCGRFEAEDGDEAVVLEEPDLHRYRKLLVDGEGRAAGAIVLGDPAIQGPVSDAVRERRPLNGALDAVRAGDWSVLEIS